MITLDVHPDVKITDYIRLALEELDALDIKATFFVTASALKNDKKTARMILEGGHQVASHGLFHNPVPYSGLPPERYDKAGESSQIEFIKEATKILEDVTGRRVTCFRSPCFSISGTTVRLLEECGYSADFSVNSQRLDLLSSDPFGCKQMFAPRLPYHPSFYNPFKKGGSRIWEIPLSSFIIPFAVMSLMSIRLKMTKLFFNMLYKESRLNRKPIVYMMHPEEFFSKSEKICAFPLKSLRLKDFLPFGGEGITARRVLRMTDPLKIYYSNKLLLKHIKSFDDIVFVTADDYIKFWLEKDS